MVFRQVLKRSNTIIGLVHDLRRLRKLVARIPQLGSRNRIITSYLASHKIRKLQIGTGPTSLGDWLCTDIDPVSDNVVYLDATRPFPFDSNTFDYVYCEHMIEHISWDEGLFMLRECRRVLVAGGTIRIATPDLEVLIGLYRRNGGELADRYVKWITNRYLAGIRVYNPSFVLNNAFRNWGHQFLYDGELMKMAMQEAGFTDIRRCLSGESKDENLRGIESHGKNVDDNEMAAFETMILEGKCPM
jgi:predicted SAM-dependent methyltransferase